MIRFKRKDLLNNDIVPFLGKINSHRNLYRIGRPAEPTGHMDSIESRSICTQIKITHPKMGAKLPCKIGAQDTMAQKL
jgi:hypothetical protein